MKTNKSDFIQFAAQMLNELAKAAIKLDMPILGYLLTMAVQEAVEISDIDTGKYKVAMPNLYNNSAQQPMDFIQLAASLES